MKLSAASLGKHLEDYSVSKKGAIVRIFTDGNGISDLSSVRVMVGDKEIEGVLRISMDLDSSDNDFVTATITCLVQLGDKCES